VNRAGGRQSFAALFFAWGILPPLLPAQLPVLELDHIYIVVQPPASLAAGALRLAGLTVDTTIERHAGQGTASIAAFFENAYLELLWVDSATLLARSIKTISSISPGCQLATTGASPFGLGLHSSPALRQVAIRSAATCTAPRAKYLLPATAPARNLAVDVFIMPASGAVTTWLTATVFGGRISSRIRSRPAASLEFSSTARLPTAHGRRTWSPGR
jgi:hypothetical protein